jgi:anti-sigma B factor antagonist
MTPKTPSPVSLAVLDHTAFVRVPGRANFASSVDFKTAFHELRQRGLDHFVVDLTDCTTMDSTFLGVLAGLAIRLIEQKGTQPEVDLELLNPNQRVTDLLENLGVVHLFRIVQDPNRCPDGFAPAKTDGTEPTKLEISKTCLEAHKTLMDVNPDNVPKFKEVAQFLADDLRRISSEKL